MNLELALTLQQVTILPQKTICKSRLDANIKSEVIRGVFLEAPFISANMSTVTSPEFCIELDKLGALGIMHRAASDSALLLAANLISKSCSNVAMSIGTNPDQLHLAKDLIRAGANIITIDVANGFSDWAIALAKHIKVFSPSTKIILGNTTDPGVLEAADLWVDAVKVGIASGRACETAVATGVHHPQFSAVLGFKDLAKAHGMPIISDGGILTAGDAAKAIGAGATSVMMGSVFASCPESAGEITEVDGKKFKVYSGMASRAVQDVWRGGVKEGTCPEGTTKYLPLGEPVAKLIERYSGGLRSSITYSKANDIASFQKNVKFARVV